MGARPQSAKRDGGLRLRRRTVIQVPCPACGAEAGEPCRREDPFEGEPRIPNHRSRVQAAKAALGNRL